MANDPRFVDMKYEDVKKNVQEILSTGTLPVVVRVVDVGNTLDNFNVFSGNLPEDTDIMLHRKLKVKYAYIKVLNYPNNAVREKVMGSEFVLEHDNYVNAEFLLPAKYHGKLKFIHRPRSPYHNVTVSQLIDTLPRYAKVRAETIVTSPNGIGKSRIIPKETQLELVRRYQEPAEGRTLLEMFDGHQTYSLSKTDRITFSEVDDPKVYHLYELVRYRMLPKVIMFQNDAPKDVIILDNQLNSAAMAAVDGPLELIGFVDIEVVVGWIRNKSDKTYTAILIPSGLWKTALVQQRYFITANDKKQFINKKYGPCKNTDFVEKGLYLTSLDVCGVTWLRSPDFYGRSDSGIAMFEPVKTDFAVSADDEMEEDESIYEEIYEKPPELPNRIPLMPLVKKKKCTFHKVHDELYGRFQNQKHVRKSSQKPPPRPPKTEKVQRAVRKLKSIPKNVEERKPVINRQTNVSDSPTQDMTYRDMSMGRKNAELPPEVKNYNTAFYSQKPSTYDKDTIAVTEADEKDSYDYEPFGIVEMNLPPLTATPTVSSNVTDSTFTGSKGQPKEQTNYSKMSKKDASHIFSDNQTQEDFYKYSVMETSHCFRHCGLEVFGDTCFENKLDGSFFQNCNLDIFKEEPFGLTNFQVLKLKKIIQLGWRPNDK